MVVGTPSKTVYVNKWLAKATLDIIGQGEVEWAYLTKRPDDVN